MRSAKPPPINKLIFLFLVLAKEPQEFGPDLTWVLEPQMDLSTPLPWVFVVAVVVKQLDELRHWKQPAYKSCF